jgi:2-methylisocitrate lyase-like PEP mutase family enzyme
VTDRQATFADLHHGERPLLLPNAWDVASALMFADAGFRAVGTTSMGIAAGEGHPDGRRGSRDATARLAGALAGLELFVSVDLEDGYSDDPGEVAAFVASLPVAGLNIEDSSQDQLVAPTMLAAKVAAIKERSPEVFVNARVDTYWLGQDASVEATLVRAGAYVAAGADGIFVPGASDPEVVRRLCAEIPVPVNVLAVPGTSVDALGELGVRRVSTGSLPYRAALHAALEAVDRVRTGQPPAGSVAYAALQANLLRYVEQAR